MDILFEKDESLKNYYGIIAVNPKKFPFVKYEDSMIFIKWLLSEDGQSTINGFKLNDQQKLTEPFAGSLFKVRLNIKGNKTNEVMRYLILIALATGMRKGEILKIAMIETKEALQELDKIMSTPGLDGIYIGPADLSLAIGEKPGFDKPEGHPTYEKI